MRTNPSKKARSLAEAKKRWQMLHHEGRRVAAPGDRPVKPRSMGDGGYPNYSYISQNAPANPGTGEVVLPFNADWVSVMKNDGAVDVMVAFDTPGGPAANARKPITLKAGESIINLPVRTANISLFSTGAVSAVRIIGHY